MEDEGEMLSRFKQERVRKNDEVHLSIGQIKSKFVMLMSEHNIHVGFWFGLTVVFGIGHLLVTLPTCTGLREVAFRSFMFKGIDPVLGK